MKKVTLFFCVLVILFAFFLFRNKSVNQKEESLTIKGSDTEVQLVSNLVEAFLENNPKENISVTGGGSGVGIASLLNGEIDLANSSRVMDEKELQLGKDKGLDIQEFVLSIDGLSVIVHPENGVQKLSMDQLSKIYKGEITNWKNVDGKDLKIVLYGRQSTSGTYTFFRNSVVKDDYAAEMRSMEGSEAIVDSVKMDKNGIGYVGVGYVKDENHQPRTDIKILSISRDEGGVAISPLDGEAVKTGEYAIARPIFQYLPHLPQKGSLLEKFLIFETSIEGQEIVERGGFFSINREQLEKNQQLLEKIK